MAASLLRPRRSTASTAIFAVIPLFVDGAVCHAPGARDLIDAAESLMKNPRRHRGRDGFANAIFAAITGVSVASAAVFSKLAIPR